MATRLRPLIMTGTALASAAAIVVSAPTIAPGHDVAIGGTPTPPRLSTAQYELTALWDISAQGLSDAYWFGWGGYIGSCCTTDAVAGVPSGLNFVRPVSDPPDPLDNPQGIYPAVGGAQPYPNDPYYPELNPAIKISPTQWQYDQNGLFVSGVPGVLYYLIDQTLDTFGSIDLDNYFFEVGSLGGYPNAPYSGWGALAYVGASELFGQNSPLAVAAQVIFKNGLTNTVNGLIVALTSPIPVIGTATSVYFTGYSNDGNDPNYYGTGVPGLLAYASTVITGLLPGISLPFAATKVAAEKPAATALTTETVAEKTAEKSDITTLKVVAEKTATNEIATDKKSQPETTESTGGTTADSTAEAAKESAVEQVKGNESPAETSGGESGAEADAEVSAPKAKTGSSAAPKTTKKVDNPLAKIGKRISDALSGGKKTKVSKSDAGDSTAGSGGASGTAG